jgi:hypothetical protein
MTLWDEIMIILFIDELLMDDSLIQLLFDFTFSYEEKLFQVLVLG